MLLVIINPASADDNQTEDTIVNDTISINELNLYDYFTEDNTLEENYTNKTFQIEGDLNLFGVLEVKAENTTFIGNNSTLKNTVLKINANGVTLKNFTMDLTNEFESNDDAGILVLADNVNIANINLNYVVPQDITAYGIYSRENSRLTLVNNKIYYEGHNDNRGVNHGIHLTYSDYALIENNTIVSSFPLRTVDYDHGGLNSVLAVEIENSKSYKLNNNTITANVNKRPFSNYPTLVAVHIINSNDGIVSNNTIFMEDFKTGLGLVNYLYGIDIHTIDNLTVISNSIDIQTTGGIMAAGTAYPIQMTGPLSHLNITYNSLYSISNGPNLGIYSMNFYGDTFVSITNNIINVTGLAGEHDWALVAGIEVQDSNDVIKNNIIEVHSVAEVGENDNLYGISYAQNIDGGHSFDIEDNLVFSEGYYAVYLLSAQNSTIKNNMLVTSREDADDLAYTGYKEGPKEHIGNTYYNNTVVSEYAYWSKILNDIDGGENTTYTAPENVNNRTNIVDGSVVKGQDSNPSYPSNPLKPGEAENTLKPSTPTVRNDDNGNGNEYSDFTRGSDSYDDYTSSANSNDFIDYTQPDTESDDFIDYTTSSSENYDEEWSDYTASSNGDSNENTYNDNSNTDRNNGISLPNAHTSNMTSNTQGGESLTQSNNGEIATNSSSTPALEGADSSISNDKVSEASQTSESPSEAGSPAKAYEITKSIQDNNKSNNIVIPIIGAIIIIALFLIGYKRKEDELKEY